MYKLDRLLRSCTAVKDTRKILKHLNSINLLRSLLLPTEEFHLHDTAYVIQKFYVSS